MLAAVERIREPVELLRDTRSGAMSARLQSPGGDAVPEGLAKAGWLPPLYPEWLGDRGFLRAHGVRFPYVTGAMANGIATARMVAEIGRAGMLGFFGAAGLSYDRVEAGLVEIARLLEGTRAAWGANLIHSPHEPDLEARVAELFIARSVPCIETSAYLGLTPSVVHVAASGLHVGPDRVIARRRRIFAKVSRPEVARLFMSPAPAGILRGLVARGKLTEAEASLAARVPLATDVTVEADSGGHTDNRPLTALMPVMLGVRDDIEAALGLPGSIRVGAAGGLGTPSAVSAAFSLGAAYVLTGSVNQGAIESGLSEEGRRMLAAADVADVAMAAAADMFELGVKLQVLRRGTLFAARANKLYDVYRDHAGLDSLPAALREELEGKIFGAKLDDVWRETEAFWRAREPREVERASADPKHRLALVCRWYLGKSSRWAIAGESSRRADFQIWCGPAMGAFNAWVKGSFLEDPAQRSVVQIALNLLEGAAVTTRAQQLRTFGVAVPASVGRFQPRRLA
ncbi:MAG TPA: PfaD family polyunsaturated fatty acid/polyketide biosynthesis protein [Nannocystaceae bacterium]|nr:PfaD family polyunsaturated fatty acid/polyketide biosynthesis protein [Nannocystaceae bacterium]